MDPQDLKFAGEPVRLEVGDRNTIREFTTFHRGTGKGGGLTTVGNDNLFMVYSHVAHDCHVGSRTIFANCATLAGHVEVGDDAVVGAFSAVQQFGRVGQVTPTSAATRACSSMRCRSSRRSGSGLPSSASTGSACGARDSTTSASAPSRRRCASSCAPGSTRPRPSSVWRPSSPVRPTSNIWSSSCAAPNAAWSRRCRRHRGAGDTGGD